MIGILVAAHGTYPSGIMNAANLILGEFENTDYIELTEGIDMDIFKEDYFNKVKTLDQGKGVIIFVDLMGATPFNTAGSLLGRFQEEGIEVRVITGVNLPMLLEGNFLREAHESVDTLYTDILNIGKDGIVELKEAMNL